MDKNKDRIICLATTLNVFRAYHIFPDEGKEFNPGIIFYIKYILGCSMASVILIGSALHFGHTMITKEYNQIDLDLSYVFSMTSGFLLFILFSMNTSSACKMYMFLSDFEQFGKPPKFDKYNNLLNKVSKYHFVYLGFTVSLFAGGSNLFKSDRCRRENEQYGYKEICGLISNTWLPFDIDYFPAKQIYLGLQFFSIYYVYMLSGTITFMVVETVAHISVRLDHVKELFVDVINNVEDFEIRRKKFNFAARYHARVLELERTINACFSNAMFSHMILTGAIIGCASFGVMQSGSANSFAVCLGWFNGMSCVCLGGQYLTNKGLELGEAIYHTKWYDMEPSLQKDLVIVLKRCQKEIVLKAAAFGVMNHSTILAIVQASYSYITLLSRSA